APREVRDDIPVALEAVVLRAMAKLPDERYSTAAELHTALLSVDLRPEDPDATMTGLAPRPATTSGLEPTAVAAPVPVPETSASGPHTPVGGTPSSGRTRHSRLLPAVVAAVAILTLVVVGIVFARSDTGQRLLHPPSKASGTPPGPVTVESVAAFDPPPGSGSEHDADVANLTDGDPNTTWATEQYGNADFGGLKTGVGVIITLNGPHKLATLEVTSTSRGWSAEVFVAARAGPGPPPVGWGDAVATKTDINGNATFNLAGRTGSTVLLWITNLGDSGSVTLGDIHLSA
ncbi:MAG: hypothetical protein M3011_02010, partial [Actinomycetota bacterium]|nr:hypothetical protein [Actinomycetota bacterium]